MLRPGPRFGSGLACLGSVEMGSCVVSEAHVIDAPAVHADRLSRHLDWQLSMQAAVTRALDEHRGHGHAVGVMRDGKLVSLKLASTEPTITQAEQ